MKKQIKSVTAWLNSNHYRLMMAIGLSLAILCICGDASATDLLNNTMEDVKDTMTGYGKKWLVLIDFGVSLGAFAMTKKPFVFFSTLGVLLAISGIAKVIGV